MTFSEFVSTYKGKFDVGNTPENKGECVGLVAKWVDELNAPHIWGNAKDLLNNASKDFFKIIPNTSEAVPQEGDIVVWSGSYNNGSGHTGIATGKGDINKFECFEQNDPLGSDCHLKIYNYNFVDGWLRPKTTPLPSPIESKFTDQTLIPKELLGEDQDAEIQQVRGWLLDGKRDNLDLANCRIENDQLKKQIDDLNNALLLAQNAPKLVPGTVSGYSTNDLFSELLRRLFGRST